MTKHGEKEFLKQLAGLGELYDKKMSTALISMYLHVLAKYEDREVSEAMAGCIEKMRFFPRPADIISLIEEDPENVALEAWGSLIKAIKGVGRYGKVSFMDGKITRLVNYLGGWDTVCDWRESDLDFRRAEFVRNYKVMKEGTADLLLTGRNSSGEVVMIGHKNRKQENGSLQCLPDTV